MSDDGELFPLDGRLRARFRSALQSIHQSSRTNEWFTSGLSEYAAPEDLSKSLSAWSTAWFQGWRKEPDGAWYPCDSEGLDLARRVKRWAGPRVTVTHVSAAGQSTGAV